ncbi:hypothetical protein D4Q52_15095 [Rhodopseudomonas palustris]|uniref:N-acetyltransferase domain-containing protein n=1 Tax=Rhodopseudomonas palustris TaxID=1076 RepID=A0A418V4H8_RHOPL|nr:hypothetical protein D4Q52_15095 [Rhodopseudomonas palustris]
MRASELLINVASGDHHQTPDADLVFAGWPAAATIPTEAAIHIVRSRADLARAAQLRRDLTDINGFCRAEAIEPIDLCSLVFVAEDRAEAVATVRLTRASDAINDRRLGLLIEAAQPEDLESAMVVSAVAVRPAPRGPALMVPLLLQVYRSAHLAGAKQSLLAAEEPMVPMFSSRGWTRTGRSFVDPEGGTVQVLKYAQIDLNALRRSDSPLLSVADDFLGR